MNAPPGVERQDAGPITRFDELKRAIAERLAGLDTCTRTLANPGHVELQLRGTPDQTLESVRVIRSSVADCRVVDCIKRGLLETQLPRVGKGTLRGVVALSVSPKASPQTVTTIDWTKESEATACVDGPDGPDPETRGLTPEAIRAVVAHSFEAFSQCYAAGLRRNRGLEGRVQVTFLVGKDGRVAEAHVVRNELPDCGVTACMLDELKGLTFPESQRPTSAVFPFVFRPDSSGK